jgi:hypothetical protein
MAGSAHFKGFLEGKYPGIKVQIDQTQWGHDPSVTLYSLNAAETVRQTPDQFVSFTEKRLIKDLLSFRRDKKISLQGRIGTLYGDSVTSITRC